MKRIIIYKLKFCIFLILFISCNKEKCTEIPGIITITKMEWKSNSEIYCYFSFLPEDKSFSGKDTVYCPSSEHFISVSGSDSIAIQKEIDSIGINIGKTFNAIWGNGRCWTFMQVPSLKNNNIEIARPCWAQPD